MKIVVPAAFGLVLAALLAWQCGVVVDETEYVVVSAFGRPTAVYNDAPGEAGLHAKAPWESALRIDRRLRVIDPPAREMITADKKNLEVSSFVLWRVSDPLRFLKAAGSPEAAEARLEERVAAALSNGLGRYELDRLATTDASRWAVPELLEGVRRDLEGPAHEDLGVEVVDVQIRRMNHPLEVRPAVFELIRSERQEVAARLQAEAEADFREITAEADRRREEILAHARAEAQTRVGAAEAEATRILNEAHARDPAFYEFLSTLETYGALLDEEATIVLSSEDPLFRLLKEGQTAVPGPPNSTPSTPAALTGTEAQNAPGTGAGR